MQGKSSISSKRRRQHGTGAGEVGEACPPSCFLQALLAKDDISVSSNFQGKEERSFGGEATRRKGSSGEIL